MFKGVLSKMRTELDQSLTYFLELGDDFLISDYLINKEIRFKFLGFSCLKCSSKEEIFRQGHCKKCFFESPSTAEWVIRPELSKAHLNIQDRDIDYEKRIQLQPHILYLSFTDDVKIGVTRKSQIPTRWIDQGAISAVEVAELPNRYLAGLCEVELKKYYKDKTNWRAMLKANKSEIDLSQEKLNAKKYLPSDLEKYYISTSLVNEITYPLESKLDAPKSINIKKLKEYKGKLIGIKGQYLIFEDQSVFNVRSNEGLVIEMELN